MKPYLIIAVGIFILVMLNGCVAVPYPEPVVVKSQPHHHYHGYHGQRGYWRRR